MEFKKKQKSMARGENKPALHADLWDLHVLNLEADVRVTSVCGVPTASHSFKAPSNIC